MPVQEPEHVCTSWHDFVLASGWNRRYLRATAPTHRMPMMIKRRKYRTLIYLALSTICTVGIFSYLLRHISPGEVLQVVSDVDRRYLLAFIILSLAGSGFRAMRYQLTLLPAGYSPSFSLLFLITLVRNVFSDLLPARIGSAVYIYLATSRLGIPVQLATSSFALSFLFDILALAPLLFVVLLFSRTSTPFSAEILSVAAGVLFIISLSLILLLPWLFACMRRVLLRLPLIPDTTRTRLLAFCEQVSSEIKLARHSRIYAPLFILSLFVRACKYGSLYAFLMGILLPLGISTEQASPLVSTLGILAAELAASLPISGIAGFGAYEGSWALTFSLLGFPEDIAALTAISHHLFTQAYGYGLGLIAVCLLMLPIPNREDISNHVFGGKIRYLFKQTAFFALACTAAFLCIQLPVAKKPAQAESLEVDTSIRNELITFLSTLPGTVIFDSNRNGTFGIFAIDSLTGQPQTILDTEFEEMYPDPSPDGTRIVYARARTDSRYAPADIWIVERDGKNSKELIKNGTFPTFSSDGRHVYFERGRTEVLQYDIETGSTRQIFPGKKKKFRGRSIVKPRVSPDGTAVAFTADIPARWNAWVAPLGKGKPEQIAAGCEPAWFSSSMSLAWVKRTGAKAGSGLMRYDRRSAAVDILRDDGGPLGHEYFPTVAGQDRYLLYSACPPDQHDHTTGAYQIHVADMTSDTAVRITYDTATNRWPKILAPVTPASVTP